MPRRMASVDTDEDQGVGLEWDFFDNLREQYVPSSAPPSDAYRVPSLLNAGDDVADGRRNNYYDLRHITNINPFLIGGAPFQVFVDSAAAGLLALHHFNRGISDVVPEITIVAERCRTRFTMDFIDTQFSPLKASRAFLEDVLERGRRRGDNDSRGGGRDGDAGRNASSAEGPERQRWRRRGRKRRLAAAVDDDGSLPPVPTVIIGAARSAVTSPLAILGGIYGVPQISYASTSTALDNRDQYPLFGRVVPSAAGDAEAAVSYLTDVLGATHIGILHVRDSYGTTYAQALSAAAARPRRTGPGSASSSSPSSTSGLPRLIVRIASFPSSSRTPEARRTVIAKAVRQMRESGLRYFFGVIYYNEYNEVMSEVMRQGIAGPGYFWMFGDAAEGLVDFQYDPETQGDLIKASRGSAILTAANPGVLAGKPRFEAFRRHWDDFRAEGSRGRAYFDSKVPPEFRDAEGGKMLRKYQFGEVQFPTELMSYDAVISAVFSVCDAEAASRRSSAAAAGVGDNDIPARVTGADVHNSFLNVTFNGLYGTISIDPATASQIPQTAPYSVSNVLTDLDESGKIKLSLAMTDVMEARGGDSGEPVSSWRSIRPFIFSDETTGSPPPLPAVQHNPNLIRSVVGAGYAMFTIVLLTSLCFSIWTRRNSERRVIKSAQPVFLYIIASGTMLMAGSIITSGVEEPTSQAGLDISCMATAWLISVGFSLTFSALFAKTWRLNRLMKRNMRRIKVDVGQVMKPAAAMVAMNANIMLVWTLVAPLRYERIAVTGSQDEFGRPKQSYGTCTLPPDPNNPDQHWWVGTFFVILITVVNSMMLAVALYQVYHARNFEVEFSESKYIALSMFSILQALIIGTPLLYVGRGHPTGFFLMLSSLIFIMCESILLLIFVPKVYFLKEWRKRQEYLQAERVRKMRTPLWKKAHKSGVAKSASVRRGSVAARFRNVKASVLDIILPQKEFDTAIANAAEEVMSDNPSYLKQGITSTESTRVEVLHSKTTEAVTVSSGDIALESTPDDITHTDMKSGVGGAEAWMKTSSIVKMHVPRISESEENSFHDETQHGESAANAANGFEVGLDEVEAWMKTSRIIKMHVPKLSQAERHSFHGETQRRVSDTDAAQVREHASSAPPCCDGSSFSRRKLMAFFSMVSPSAKHC